MYRVYIHRAYVQTRQTRKIHPIADRSSSSDSSSDSTDRQTKNRRSETRMQMRTANDNRRQVSFDRVCNECYSSHMRRFGRCNRSRSLSRSVCVLSTDNRRRKRLKLQWRDSRVCSHVVSSINRRGHRRETKKWRMRRMIE